MTEFLKVLNTNSGGLTVFFTAVVTVATSVYAVLTWILVTETRMMREVQTEPKLQVAVSSFDFAIHIVRLHIRNVGARPSVRFLPRVPFEDKSAEKILAKLTNVKLFSVGLKYVSPGQEQVSACTRLTEDHDEKVATSWVSHMRMQLPGA